MNELLQTILWQAVGYSTAMILTLFIIGFFQRGFFINYFRVKSSFGRLVLIKKRTMLRDYFTTGEIKEGCLHFKFNKKKLFARLLNEDGSNNYGFFYKCVNVMWVDYDEEKNALAKTDYSAVTGYDLEKISEVVERSLLRPTIDSGTMKVIMWCAIIGLILTVVVGVMVYMTYKNSASCPALLQSIPSILSNVKGTITGGTTAI